MPHVCALSGVSGRVKPYIHVCISRCKVLISCLTCTAVLYVPMSSSFFGPEFYNSSTRFAHPRIFLDLIFSRSRVPAETLISCLESPSEMSHHDTLHFQKTLDTLRRHAGGPGVSARGPEGPGPGEHWTLPASSEMGKCFIHVHANSHLSGLHISWSEILSPSLSFHCPLFIPVL